MFALRDSLVVAQDRLFVRRGLRSWELKTEGLDGEQVDDPGAVLAIVRTRLGRIEASS